MRKTPSLRSCIRFSIVFAKRLAPRVTRSPQLSEASSSTKARSSRSSSSRPTKRSWSGASSQPPVPPTRMRSGSSSSARSRWRRTWASGGTLDERCCTRCRRSRACTAARREPDRAVQIRRRGRTAARRSVGEPAAARARTAAPVPARPHRCPPRIKATTLESQLIHLIQELSGRTLRQSAKEKLAPWRHEEG
jgi:hypothetical protein